MNSIMPSSIEARTSLPQPPQRERGQPAMSYSLGWNRRMIAIANLYKSKKRRQEERNNKEEIREKKMRMRKGSDIITNSCSCLLDDDVVICEILTRLPTKSLMRFKSVCKRWLSLIQHDPHFHDLHFTQSRTRSCLFFLFPLNGNPKMFYGFRECFFSTDFDEGRAPIRTISKTEESFVYSGILKPVNGLICFFYKKGVCIYNPGTREITPWIYSTLVMEDDKEQKYPTYGFGFDPATKEHKVICVWRKHRPTPLVACEILTVGHNKWRRIDEVVPPYEFEVGSVYANGSIYWCNKYSLGEWCMKNDDPEVIMAFDVGSEKFRTIPVPNFILEQPCDRKQYCGPHIDLLQVDGHVAQLRRMDDYTVKLWIFFDDHNYDKKENITTTTSNTNWTDLTIKLPFCWDTNVKDLSFHGGVAGTDQIILLTKGPPQWLVSLYSYNRKMQIFKKLEISGISSIHDPCMDTLFSPFAESLLPVSNSSGTALSLQLERESPLSVQELRSPCMLFIDD